MDDLKAKKFKRWSSIFVIIGVLSLIDIATRSLVQESYNLNDAGYIIIGSIFLFKALFGASVAATLSTIVSIIVNLSIVWLILGHFMNQKAKLIKTPITENKKNYKRAKIFAIIVGIIFLSAALYGFLSAILK